MKQGTTEGVAQTVGLDVGDRFTFLCVLEQESGEVLLPIDSRLKIAGMTPAPIC